ncbi:MAG: hypothetical protein D6718_04135 [Acidobacteria bacterium]|nr:MAG: hypothetical protein D6718_04135 [Acidobacteriota bacterium]
MRDRAIDETRRRRARLVAGGLCAALILMTAPVLRAAETAPGPEARKAELERLIAFDRATKLDAEQQKVMAEALSPMPAPCCSDFSAATCCCKCNLARAMWGRAKQLVLAGRSAAEVRKGVHDWLARMNPSGFAGDACHKGHCGRGVSKDGCGGMRADHITP